MVPIWEQLTERHYPVPELQQRFDDCGRIIKSRYRVFDYKICTNLSSVPEGFMREGLSSAKDGVATLMLDAREFWITRWDLEHGSVMAHTEREQFLADHMVVVILHELEHLAGDADLSDHSREGHLRAELEAWSRTCEYALAPLVETHHHPVYPSLKKIYQVWVSGGRSSNSPEFIRQIGGDQLKDLK